MNDSPLQQIIRTGCHCRCFMAGKRLWIDQVQMLQTHHFHGPCSGADVAGMTGIDQNNAYM